MEEKRAGETSNPRLGRSWPALTIGFGGLLILIGLLTSTTYHRAQKIFGGMSAIHKDFQQNNELMTQIQVNLYLSGLLVRDYLLDSSVQVAISTRQELKQVHADMSQSVERLGQQLGQEDAQAIGQLNTELNSFMDSLEPIFEWTPEEKLANSRIFLRRYVLPRRMRALELAREVSSLNALNFQRQEKRLRQQQEEFRQYLIQMMIASVSLGLLVAGISIFRIFRLEKRTTEQYRQTELAEQELRFLSQRLVQAQEEERKAISRDLHDQVGQLLTGLRMELGHLDQLRTGPAAPFQDSLGEIKRLTEQTLRVVRDMSMGLRPSMLDDLGLSPALEWLARDFSRRSGMVIETEIDGVLENLPESHRTCVYRVVQETLTNCVRHSQARNVRLSVHGSPERVSVVIQDDGIGLKNENLTHQGIGLIGIEERVRELGGTLQLESHSGKGTLIRAEIPFKQEESS